MTDSSKLSTEFSLLASDHWLPAWVCGMLTTDNWLLINWLLTSCYWLLATDKRLLITVFWHHYTDFWPPPPVSPVLKYVPSPLPPITSPPSHAPSLPHTLDVFPLYHICSGITTIEDFTVVFLLLQHLLTRPRSVTDWASLPPPPPAQQDQLYLHAGIVQQCCTAVLISTAVLTRLQWPEPIFSDTSRDTAPAAMAAVPR